MGDIQIMFEWNYYLLFLISVVTVWLSSFLRGIYAKKTPSDSVYMWYFDFLQNTSCLIGVSSIYILSGLIGTTSLFTVLLGVALGVVIAISLNLNLVAFSCGPFSYTSVIVSLSAIIPTISGLFFGEKISLMQYVGIAFMVLCIILSPSKSNDISSKKTNFKWIIFCLSSAVFSGLVGVIQKVHQSSISHRDEMSSLLIIGFLVSAVFAGIKFALESRKVKNEKPHKEIKINIFIPIACGIAFAFPHTINLYLVGKFPTVVFFPIVNLTPMMLSTLSAIIVFKEHLSVKRWIGIAIGVLSTVFVSGMI